MEQVFGSDSLPPGLGSPASRSFSDSRTPSRSVGNSSGSAGIREVKPVAARFEYTTLQYPASEASLALVANVVERVARDGGDILARAAIGLETACTHDTWRPKGSSYGALAEGSRQWPRPRVHINKPSYKHSGVEEEIALYPSDIQLSLVAQGE